MTSYNTSNIKNGLKILINNEPYEIIENSFHKPGKGPVSYTHLTLPTKA